MRDAKKNRTGSDGRETVASTCEFVLLQIFVAHVTVRKRNYFPDVF